MSFEYFIGGRYLRARKKQAFITIITVLSIAGITVGVMALIVVIGVMKGLEDDLHKGILGGQSHILLKHENGTINGYRQLVTRIEKIEGVKAATPFSSLQGILRSKYSLTPAIIKGIDPSTAGLVLDTLKSVTLPDNESSTLQADNQAKPPAIVLARELAKHLGVSEGDIISLTPLGKSQASLFRIPTMRQFEVSGYFESGYYEFDKSFAYILLGDAQKILQTEDSVTDIGIRVKDPYKAKKIAELIDAEVGLPYEAQDWMKLNKSLFQAIENERLAMFIILILIILVAAFSIASSLFMLVSWKKRDIAILKTMGATNKSIQKIFVFNGMVIGLVGTGLGLGLGLLLSVILKNYDITRLTGGIFYFMKTVPVKLEIADITATVSSALIICYLATLAPARMAAKNNPVESLRHT